MLITEILLRFYFGHSLECCKGMKGFLCLGAVKYVTCMQWTDIFVFKLVKSIYFVYFFLD